MHAITRSFMRLPSLMLQDIYNAIFSEMPELVYPLPCQWNIQLSPTSESEKLCAHAFARLPPGLNVPTFEGGGEEMSQRVGHMSTREGEGRDMILHWNAPNKLFHQQYLNDYMIVEPNESNTYHSHLDYLRHLYYYYQQMDGTLVKELHESTHLVASSGLSTPTGGERNESIVQDSMGSLEDEKLRRENMENECKDFHRESLRTYRLHPFYFDFDFDSLGNVSTWCFFSS